MTGEQEARRQIGDGQRIAVQVIAGAAVAFDVGRPEIDEDVCRRRNYARVCRRAARATAFDEPAPRGFHPSAHGALPQRVGYPICIPWVG